MPRDTYSARVGAVWVEMNTIFARINRRPSGQPTKKELARITTLKAELKALKALYS